MSRLHLEPEAVRREVLRKAAMVRPAFNKGGLQYVTDTSTKIPDPRTDDGEKES